MARYWPGQFEVSDTQSPLEILEDALKDWESSSGGILTLVFQEGESKSGDDLTVVHAKHTPSNRTATLFSVVSRKDLPYPVRLFPKSEELPRIFKKSYIEESGPIISALAPSFGSGIGGTSPRLVKNEWVADTPGEFRELLEKAFNAGTVQSEVLNLISFSRRRDSHDATRLDQQAEKEPMPPPTSWE